MPWQCGHGRVVHWAVVRAMLLTMRFGRRPSDGIFSFIHNGRPLAEPASAREISEQITSGPAT